jgi:ornithine cyclodeaminase
VHPQIITEQVVRESISFDEASIAAIEKAFASLASGSAVVMPPVMQINVDAVQGQTCVKSAYTPGDAFFVVKLASTFHQNHKLDVPNASGLMLVCNSQTGHVECILLDNGYLTALRTQAAGAVAAKHLSRWNSKSAALIGAGRQARLQLVALLAVRPIERAVVWSPNAKECEAFASDMRENLGIDVRSSDSAEAAVRGADIIVTATPARTPVVKAEWLSQGQHITAMGADAPGKSELWPETLLKATLYACDREQQCRSLSELHAAIEAGVVPADFPAAEIGDIVSGLRTGRRSDADITIADLTGLGVQDTAIALLAWSKIRNKAV